jgi:hypothetical protein
MALSKTTKIIESKELQLHFEAFNVFNHAQFSNPDGEINDGLPQDGETFGLITSARDARIMQIGAKILFCPNTTVFGRLGKDQLLLPRRCANEHAGYFGATVTSLSRALHILCTSS